MIIGHSFAWGVHNSRRKSLVCGICSILYLLWGIGILILINLEMNQLIFQIELVIASFFLIITNFTELKNVHNDLYIVNMAFLTKEFKFDDQYMQQDLDAQIENQLSISKGCCNCSFYYAVVKIEFHHQFCQTKHFIFLLLCIAVLFQGFIDIDFLEEHTYVLFVCYVIIMFHDCVILSIGIVIEMPRRIRQYYRFKKLYKVERSRSVSEQQMQTVLVGSAQQSEIIQRPIQIQEIPKKAQVNQEEEQVCCAICTMELADDSILKQLQCHPTHIFHIDCIISWKNQLIGRNIEPNCPICRKPMKI